MEDYICIQCKEHGGLQLYSIKSMEDCSYIQYKEYGGLQLYTV